LTVRIDEKSKCMNGKLQKNKIKLECQVTTVVEELLNYTDRWNQPMTGFIQNIRAMRWAVFTI
jgi:hypothetical protein